MRDHAGVKGLQRAELARRTGSNLETVRYYEKVGLLQYMGGLAADRLDGDGMIAELDRAAA